MRLIDADLFEVIGYTVPKEYDTDRFLAGVDFIVEKIDNAPTVEEREKGRWIYDGKAFEAGHEWMHCSVCHYSDIWVPMTRTNYCPCCGSKMEVEES